MSFSILLFKNYHKKTKSTAIPDITGSEKDNYINIQVSLKDETDISNPSFLLSANILGDLDLGKHIYSYVYWQDLDRYYFVRTVTQVTKTLYRLDCDVDYLGTYRRMILDSVQFVVYSEKKINSNIADTRLVPSTTPLRLTEMSDISIFPNEDYCVLVNVVSQNSYASKLSGGISQYIFDTQEDFTTFLTNSFHMYEDVDLELCLRLYMTGTTPDSILSANYLPYTPTSTLKTQAYIGTYDTGVTVSYATNATDTTEHTLTIPWFDDDMRYRTSTYYKAQLYLPLVGCIGLAIEDIANQENILIQYVFDNVNGSYLCTVFIGGKPQYIYQGSVSSSIQFSTITNDPIQGYMNLASSASKLLSGNVTGALGSVIDGIGEFTRADTTVIGDYNTRITTQYLQKKPLIQLQYHTPQVNSLDKNRGNLFCARSLLSNHAGGYVQTENAFFETSHLSLLNSECDLICNALDNGIFLE